MESATEIPAASAEAPKGKPFLLYGVIVTGLAVGAGIGLFVVAPKFGKPTMSASSSTAAAEHGKSAEGKEGKGGKEGEAAAKSLHVIDNLVLNPAGSGGTRFLMATVTFEMKDAATVELIKNRDAEVRDILLALLGKKTVDELADVTLREGIKKEMIAALEPLFPGKVVSKVYFPQFVIQ